MTSCIASAEFTQHVEGYGLVRDARSNPRLSIGLVKAHLARQPKKIPESDSSDLEGLLAEISRRRNRIEIALRLFLREGLLFAEGKKAMDTALSALTGERRAVLSQYSYLDFWTELYFNELTAILSKYYQVFQKRIAEERATVLSWMDQVNKCRSDAHAKRLSEEDLAYLRVCFRRLEEMLNLQ
jgi:hypothetical protein